MITSKLYKFTPKIFVCGFYFLGLCDTYDKNESWLCATFRFFLIFRCHQVTVKCSQNGKIRISQTNDDKMNIVALMVRCSFNLTFLHFRSPSFAKPKFLSAQDKQSTLGISPLNCL